MSKDKKKEERTEELSERAREIWLAGLGALASVEEEGSKLYKNLVKKGEDFEGKSKEQVDSVLDSVSENYKKVEKQFSDVFSKAEDTFEESVAKVVKGLGVPTQDEVSTLTKKVDKLTRKVENLSDKLEEKQSESKSSQSSSGSSQKK